MSSPAYVEQPQSDEAERSVLGAILVDNAKLTEVADTVRPEDFYAPVHQRIFGSMLDMAKAAEPIDLLTLAERHASDGALEVRGGATYLSRLMDGIPRLINVRHYADIVRDRATRRAVMRLGGELATEAPLEPDLRRLLDSAAKRLQSLQQQGQGSAWRAQSVVLAEVLDELERRALAGAGYSGLVTGLHDLDELTDGLQPQDLIVVAAATSVGKTAFAGTIADHASIHGGRVVAFFSLEMSDTELVKRAAFGEARVNSQRARRGALTDDDWSRLTGAYSRMKPARVFYDSSVTATAPQMLARCRHLANQQGRLDLVIVDYLQLVTPSRRSSTREEDVASIARELKAMARELRCPVLALSQLNKEADKRDGPPQISDVRESGAIVHAADIFAFLWRKDLQQARLGKQVAAADVDCAELVIIKHRKGPLQNLHLRWNGAQTRFVPAARAHQEARRDPKSLAAGDGPTEPSRPRLVDDDDRAPF